MLHQLLKAVCGIYGMCTVLKKTLHICFYTWKWCVSFKAHLFVSFFEDINFWMAYLWQLLFCCVMVSDLRISFNGEEGITGYFHTAVWCLLHCWQPEHWVMCVPYVFQSCPGMQLFEVKLNKQLSVRRGVRNVPEDKCYSKQQQLPLHC